MYYYETNSVNPYFNLAFEEYILQNKTEGKSLILWQNDNTIVVGQNQNTEAEINSTFVKEHGINVVRRKTGGGAVYHDLNNLNYSFITDASEASSGLQYFTEPICKALRTMGISAEASGRNDIVVDGKKISGTAQRIYKNRILHHGTLLFDSNIEIMQNALNVDSRKFVSKNSSSVHSRVGNIKDFLNSDMTIFDFWRILTIFFENEGFEKQNLKKEELDYISEISKNTYATWEWNYGHTPMYEMSNSKRFDGGTVEVNTNIEKGIIKNITFRGDFLSKTSLDEFEAELVGHKFEINDVANVMEAFNLSNLFGTITKNDLIELMFSE